ncbi:MAG: dipicolinate synthase subunit DpsA [Ruminococcus sp.]|nr:dipicolinate synthase subunit DpsA [Ruminococcus sp.]MEE1106283.1 dipicolinate synthase subunit DpsA [Ruminococcus sp.]
MSQPIKTFGIIGGDKRQLFLAQSLLNSGCNVILAGFGKLRDRGFDNLSGVEAAVLYSDAVILPLPCVRADKSVNAPFAARSIFFSEAEQRALREKPVFAAMCDRLVRAYPLLDGGQLYDYAAREDFAILNAVPTAEGAVELAMQHYEGTVFGSRSLVVGFGRIGRLLAKMLHALGSDVTVSARKPSDFAYIEALGYRVKNTQTLTLARGYDLIFNTVPSMIFDEALLKNTDPAVLLIDLASLPGGVDFESAHRLGIDARRALALPGKCAPKTAGEIIKKTVFSIIEEVNR